MIFDISKALSLPDIHNSVAKREGVLNRFGPLFRDPTRLKKQDYLDFLSFKHNHHWTGLERLGRPAAENMENLRGAITLLVNESLPLAERFDSAIAQISGVSWTTLTPILLIAYPARYGVWNGTSEPEMRERGLWPAFPRGATAGEKYEVINAVLVDLARDHGVDLWTLDALWWVGKLERQNTGHYKNDWFKAVWSMADQAEKTAQQANGQTVDRILKNKDLRLSKQALIDHLNELLEECDFRCAISGLALQPTIGGKRLRRGARLWSVATATFKAETYRFLRIERPSDEDRATGMLDAPGTIHLPGWADTEWLKQLVAEQLVTIRNKRGYAHQEWQKMRERNEALDCRVYARAAAWILGADRWDEATWRRLEAQAGVETRLPVAVAAAATQPDPAQPKAGTLTTPRRKRRAYTPNFMRD